MMTTANHCIQAIVLSGGGAYASYEVGALMALFSGASAGGRYAPVEPRIFTGTSSGAFNAALLVAQLAQPDRSALTAAEYLEQVWLNHLAEQPIGCGQKLFRLRANPLDFLAPACLLTNPLGTLMELARDAAFLARDSLQRGVEVMLSTEALETRALALLDLSAFISNNRLRQLVRELIPLADLRRARAALRIAAANWRTGELQLFENSEMSEEEGHEIILASAAIPGLIRPVMISGTPYVDGGIVMNTPLLPAIEAGADTLHVIYLDPDIKNIPLQRLQHMLDVFDRIRTIGFAVRMNEDIDHAREINQGLAALAAANQGRSPAVDHLSTLLRLLGQIEQRAGTLQKLRPVTIHRYHPRDELGGPLGLLNFSRREIERLITRGYDDTARHDCATSDCILPQIGPQSEC